MGVDSHRPRCYFGEPTVGQGYLIPRVSTPIDPDATLRAIKDRPWNTSGVNCRCMRHRRRVVRGSTGRVRREMDAVLCCASCPSSSCPCSYTVSRLPPMGGQVMASSPRHNRCDGCKVDLAGGNLDWGWFLVEEHITFLEWDDMAVRLCMTCYNDSIPVGQPSSSPSPPPAYLFYGSEILVCDVNAKCLDRMPRVGRPRAAARR